MRGGLLEGVAQVGERLEVALVEAGEGVLGGAEALRDDVRPAGADERLLGVHHLGQAGDSLGLGDAGLDQDDVGVRGHGVRVLDVQGGFAGPAGVVGVGGVEGRDVAPLHDLDLGVRDAPLLVEDLQVVLDGRRAEGVDDDDGAALAGDALLVEGVQVVGLAVLERGVAVDAELADAVRGGQRRGPAEGVDVAGRGGPDVDAGGGRRARGGGARGEGGDGAGGDGAGREGGGPDGEQGQGAAEGAGAAHGTPWDVGPAGIGRVGWAIPSTAA